MLGWRYVDSRSPIYRFVCALTLLAGGTLGLCHRQAAAESSDLDATHHQTALIQVVDGGGLNTFCLDDQGNILAGLDGDAQEGAAGEIRVYTPSGELKDSWQTPVKTEAINTDPEGNLFVAGDGKILKYNRSRELVLEADAPHAKAMKANAAGLREQVLQQAKQRSASYAQQIPIYERQVEQLEEQLATLEANEQRSAADEQRIAVYKRAIETYRQRIEDFKSAVAEDPEKGLTEEQIQQQIAAMIRYKLAASSISATGDAVFIACRAQEGYGFDVWRTKPDLTGGKCIVTGLRGCCGQMDVQASDAGVFVAENSRKRVCRFDSQGEKVCEWGESSSASLEGFGSCCNPMNVAFGPDGEVYTAEATSGRIKRYNTDGKLLGLVGSVEIVPGCKKVSIAVSEDGDQVYMLDITRGHIVVMTRNPDAGVAAAAG